MRMHVVGLAVVVSVLAWSSLAVADPIVITAGNASGRSDGDMTGFQLFGDGTAISATSFGPAPPQGLHAGQSVVIHGGVTATVGGNAHHPVSATVNGTVYPSVWLFGALDFLGAPFVPPPAQAGAFINSFQTTFTMNGHLEGFADVDGIQPAGARLFAVDVTGSGAAFAGPYRAIVDNVWNTFDGATAFVFEAASPTPEPATMVLLASGLVIAGARRFRAARSLR